jgi:putative flippase GtrA
VDPNPLPAGDRALAVTILVLWGAAITAGRLTAYDDASVQWQTAVATLVVSVVMLVVGFIVVRLFSWIRTALKGDATTVVPSHGNATVR